MASICNDERAPFGVMSGHDRKTLSLWAVAQQRGRCGGQAEQGTAPEQAVAVKTLKFEKGAPAVLEDAAACAVQAWRAGQSWRSW